MLDSARRTNVRKLAYTGIIAAVAVAVTLIVTGGTSAATVPTTQDAYASEAAPWPGYSDSDTRVMVGRTNNDKVYGGWRFTGLDIPADAIITTAYVELVQQEWGSLFESTFVFENVKDAKHFTEDSTPLDRWDNRTIEEAPWIWTRVTPGTQVRSPSLVAAMQELVDNYGSLENVVLIEAPADSTPPGQYHQWGSMESGQGARLVIEYTNGDGSGDTVATVTPTNYGSSLAPNQYRSFVVPEGVVAFSAWASDDGDSGTAIFDIEGFDRGGAYDASTGIFTAPVPGLYEFKWGTPTSVPSLVVKGVEQHRLGTQASVILELEAGDEVMVTTTVGFRAQVENRNAYFTGYLLRPYGLPGEAAPVATPTPEVQATPTPASIPGGDMTPPLVTSMSISPSVVPASLGPQVVTFTVRTSDDLSGVKYVNIFIRSASGAVAGTGNAVLVAGDARDGTYELRFIVPQYAPTGTWEVKELQVFDSVGNMRKYVDRDLVQNLGTQPNTIYMQDAGLPNEFTVE